MKARITHAERLRIAEWITDAQQLLAGVETIERQVAATLGFGPTEDRDVITDTLSIPLSVDRLLADLSITVEEPS